MHEDKYVEIEIAADYRLFTFISKGRLGDIVKVVSFDEIDETNNVFNLALGSKLPNGTIDYETITNNGDRNKILASVADIVLKFLTRYPSVKIFITGSDSRRTMLYQRAIAYKYDELTKLFNIYGDLSEDSSGIEFESFDLAKTYSAFLIEKKKLNGE